MAARPVEITSPRSSIDSLPSPRDSIITPRAKKGKTGFAAIGDALSNSAKKLKEIASAFGSITAETFSLKKKGDPKLFITQIGDEIKLSQDPDFYFFCKFLSDRLVSFYVQKEDAIIEDIKKEVPISLKEKVSRGIKKNQRLIKHTIEANVFNLFFNLLKRANVEKITLQTAEKEPPFVKFIALFGCYFDHHLKNLEDIENEGGVNRETKLKKAIRDFSFALLKLIFPEEQKSLKLYFDLPIVSAVQEFSWNKIRENFPELLFTLYTEFRAGIKENDDSNWEECFDRFTGIKHTYQMLTSSSLFVQNWVSDSSNLDVLKNLFENIFKDIKKGKDFSRVSVQYLAGYITTPNSYVQKVGKFFQNYFLKHFLRKFVDVRIKANDRGFFGSFLQFGNTLFRQLDNYDLNIQSPLITNNFLNWIGQRNPEDLPIPPLFQHLIGLKIIEIQNRVLPVIFKNQMSPVWPLFVNKNGMKGELEALLNDSSITNMVEFFSDSLVTKGITAIQIFQQPLFKEPNPVIPLLFLKDTHKNQLEHQVRSFLINEPHQIILIKGCLKTYLEGTLFTQLLKQYKLFLRTCREHYLGEKTPPSFVSWMMNKIAEIFIPFSQLLVESKEQKKFKKILALKREIERIEGLEQREEKLKRLRILFLPFKSKFKQVIVNTLNFLGVNNSQDLPVPAGLQDFLWSFIEEKAPQVLFDEISEVLDPIFEREDLRIEVELLPHGEMLVEGCHCIAKDLITFLPDWFDNYINIAHDLNKEFLADALSPSQLNEMAKELEKMVEDENVKVKHLLTLLKKYGYMHASNSIESKSEEVKKYKERLECICESPRKLLDNLQFAPLSSKFKDWICLALESFIKNENGDFNAHLNFFENYIQSHLYKIVLNLNHLLSSKFIEEEGNKLKHLISNLKKETPEQAQIEIQKYVDHLFKKLGLKYSHSLYGIPKMLRDSLFPLVKKNIVTLAHGFYKSARMIHVKHDHDSLFHTTIDTENFLQTLQSSLHFGIHTALDKISEPTKGTLKGIELFYKASDEFLSEKKDVKTAAFIREVFRKGYLTPVLENILNGLKENDSRVLLLSVAKEFEPQITGLIDKYISSLLQKEQEKGLKFDQRVIESFLTLFTKHLDHLNQAVHKKGGITIQNFVEVARKDLHSAIKLNGNEKEYLDFKKTHFYVPFAKDFMKFLFPGGKKDLKAFFPDIPASARLAIWRGIKTALANGVLVAVETLFEEETLTELLVDSMKEIEVLFEAPLHLEQASTSNVGIVNQAIEKDKKLEALVENFLKEGAAFFNLSIAKADTWPKWKKRVLFWDRMKSSCVTKIANIVKEKIDGQLFSKALKELFSKPREIKYHSKTIEEKKVFSKQLNQKFSKLQRKIAVSSLSYATKMFRGKLNFYMNSIKGGITKAFLKGFIAIWSFILTKLLWPINKLFKIEKRIQNKIHSMIEFVCKRVIERFKNAEIQENFIFHFADAFKAN